MRVTAISIATLCPAHTNTHRQISLCGVSRSRKWGVTAFSYSQLIFIKIQFTMDKSTQIAHTQKIQKLINRASLIFNLFAFQIRKWSQRLSVAERWDYDSCVVPYAQSPFCMFSVSAADSCCVIMGERIKLKEKCFEMDEKVSPMNLRTHRNII